nr:MAG TPA: hypothetical protein [Bacteriophage sp.]
MCARVFLINYRKYRSIEAWIKHTGEFSPVFCYASTPSALFHVPLTEFHQIGSPNVES